MYLVRDEIGLSWIVVLLSTTLTKLKELCCETQCDLVDTTYTKASQLTCNVKYVLAYAKYVEWRVYDLTLRYNFCLNDHQTK
jgi:hypothetical protein